MVSPLGDVSSGFALDLLVTPPYTPPRDALLSAQPKPAPPPRPSGAKNVGGFQPVCGI